MKKYSQEDLLTDPYMDEPDKEEIPKWAVASFRSLGEFGVGDARHNGNHNGIDLGTDKGQSVYPMLSGTVIKISKEAKPWKEGDPKQGNAVTISHIKGIDTFYAHLQSISVGVGEKVTQDTVIGTVGNTGNAIGTSPHVHFEVRVNKSPVNPRGIIGKSVDLIAKNDKKSIKIAEDGKFWNKVVDRFEKILSGYISDCFPLQEPFL